MRPTLQADAPRAPQHLQPRPCSSQACRDQPVPSRVGPGAGVGLCPTRGLAMTPVWIQGWLCPGLQPGLLVTCRHAGQSASPLMETGEGSWAAWSLVPWDPLLPQLLLSVVPELRPQNGGSTMGPGLGRLGWVGRTRRTLRTHVLCLGELHVRHGWYHAQHRRARWPDAGASPPHNLLHIPREQPASMVAAPVATSPGEEPRAMLPRRDRRSMKGLYNLPREGSSLQGGQDTKPPPKPQWCQTLQHTPHS